MPRPEGNSAPDILDLVQEGLVPRLSTVHGRPTDPSWDMQRLVPMSEVTWTRLQEIAGLVSSERRKVAAGQIAAFLIELSLEEYEA